MRRFQGKAVTGHNAYERLWPGADTLVCPPKFYFRARGNVSICWRRIDTAAKTRLHIERNVVAIASQALQYCLRGALLSVETCDYAAASAVVGSITERTRAIELAGNPPFCACDRTMSSLVAT